MLRKKATNNWNLFCNNYKYNGFLMKTDSTSHIREKIIWRFRRGLRWYCDDVCWVWFALRSKVDNWNCLNIPFYCQWTLSHPNVPCFQKTEGNYLFFSLYVKMKFFLSVKCNIAWHLKESKTAKHMTTI